MAVNDDPRKPKDDDVNKTDAPGKKSTAVSTVLKKRKSVTGSGSDSKPTAGDITKKYQGKMQQLIREHRSELKLLETEKDLRKKVKKERELKEQEEKDARDHREAGSVGVSVSSAVSEASIPSSAGAMAAGQNIFLLYNELKTRFENLDKRQTVTDERCLDLSKEVSLTVKVDRQQLETENAELKNEIQQLRSEKQGLQTANQELQQEVISLKSEVEELRTPK